MVNQPDLGNTIRRIVERLDQLATRPIGRVTLGPGDGHIRVVDDTGTDIAHISSAGNTARVGSTMADVGQTLHSHAQTLAQHATDLGKKAWTAYVDERLTNLHDVVKLKAWTGYVANVDTRRYDGDKALKAEIGKRATKAEVNAANEVTAANINALAKRVRDLENKTSSPGYTTTYTPPATYNDDLGGGYNPPQPSTNDDFRPPSDPFNPNPL